MNPEELLARFLAVREAVAFVEIYELLPVLMEMVRQGSARRAAGRRAREPLAASAYGPPKMGSPRLALLR
jgi:hypothetical protein